MDKFISEHLIDKEVDVHCGGDNNFSGKVIANADGVLTLETDKGIYTHIATDKIIAACLKK